MPPSAPPQIPYEEMAGFPKESMTAAGFSATRQIKTAWATRLTLARRFLGGKIGGVDYFPAQYPDFPDAICVKADPQPFGQTKKKTSTQAKYDDAIITLQYEVPAYDSQNNTTGTTVRPYRTENLRPQAKMISLTSEKLFWAAGEALAGVSAPQKLMLQLTWVITLHEVPTKLPSETFSLIGKTNKAAVKSAQFNRTFAAGTLLFTPPDPRPTRRTDGNLTWEARYELIYQPEGWNNFYNPNTDAFEPVYSDNGAGTVVQPYTPADFTPITDYKP